jgi:hypothetical protein
MALALFDDDEAPRPKPAHATAPRESTKNTLLRLLSEVGAAGLNNIIAVEMAEQRGVHLQPKSVASRLSRLKADGAIVYEGQRYKLKQFAGLNIANQPLHVVR